MTHIPCCELGRFCVSPDVQNPDVLRIAWGMLAKVVDARAVGLLSWVFVIRGNGRRTYTKAPLRFWRPTTKRLSIGRLPRKPLM